jgi:hypothetical protein
MQPFARSMGLEGISLSLPRPPKTNLLRCDLSHDEPFAANPNPTAPRFRQSPVYSLYEADVIDLEGHKSNFLEVVAPKLEKHGIKYRVGGGTPKALTAEPLKNHAGQTCKHRITTSCSCTALNFSHSRARLPE